MLVTLSMQFPVQLPLNKSLRSDNLLMVIGNSIGIKIFSNVVLLLLWCFPVLIKYIYDKDIPA